MHSNISVNINQTTKLDQFNLPGLPGYLLSHVRVCSPPSIFPQKQWPLNRTEQHERKPFYIFINGSMNAQPLLTLETITHRILLLRGQKVLLDADLASLYGVETRRVNEQVRRNRERFPKDFIFEVTDDELANLKSHFATSSWGGRRKRPMAFTEHGAIMAATILKSPRAVEMSVYVVRAFVRLREVLASNAELSKRLDDLEQATEELAMRHDALAHNTRAQLKQVFEAIRELMSQDGPKKKRPIGFTSWEEK